MEKIEAVVAWRKQINVGRVLVGILAGALIVQGLLRMWVAVELLLTPGIEGQLGAMVHWRIFDQFIGWFALLVLAMADEEAGADGWGKTVIGWLLGVGLVALAGSLMWRNIDQRAIMDIIVATILAIAAAVIVGRQLLAFARSRAGLNLEQLWRGVALQWVLLWVATEVALRIRFWRDGVESDERARVLVFVLPVLGVMPNVITAMGIRWWRQAQGRALAAKGQTPIGAGGAKIRAWMVSLVALNLGAMCSVAAVWIGWLGIVGAVAMILATGMYALGFPKGAWRLKGKMVPASLGLFVLGLGMMGGEWIMQAGGSIVPMLYSAAWRHLLSSVLVLWLVGMGGLALNTIVDERVRAGTRGAVMASGFMILLGTLATSATMLAGIESRDIMQGLFVGTGLELFGVVVATAAALRGSAAIRQNAPA